MTTIVVGTSDGVHRFDEGGTRLALEHEGTPVTSLGPSGSELWAVLDGADVWRWSGAGWDPVASLEGFRATCITAIDHDVLVGTPEAHLFRIAERSIERVDAFETVEGRSGWYTPWGGPPDTRSIANWDEDVYVNVHVGGIPRTDDGGASWTPTIDVDADVHHVTTAEGLVIAACAGGVATSRDRGATWTYRTDGLDARYSRAVAVCGDALLATASRGPRGGDAGVYRGSLGAGAFERCRDGLPDPFDDNIDTYHLDALREGSVAAFGTGDGRVFVSDDRGARWGLLADGLPRITRVLVLP